MDLASLEDTLDLLSDPTALAAIEQARQEVRSGRLLTAEQLRDKYLAR